MIFAARNDRAGSGMEWLPVLRGEVDPDLGERDNARSRLGGRRGDGEPMGLRYAIFMDGLNSQSASLSSPVAPSEMTKRWLAWA